MTLIQFHGAVILILQMRFISWSYRMAFELDSSCQADRSIVLFDEMPTVLRIGAFRFHFYSDEQDEPPHIHVACADGECKFWLEPVRLARNRGLAPHVVRKAERLVFEHQEILTAKFHEFH